MKSKYRKVTWQFFLSEIDNLSDSELKKAFKITRRRIIKEASRNATSVQMKRMRSVANKNQLSYIA